MGMEKPRDPIQAETLIDGDPVAARAWWNEESQQLLFSAADDVFSVILAASSQERRAENYARSLKVFCAAILGVPIDQVPPEMTYDDALKQCTSAETYGAALRLMWESAVRDSSLQLIMAMINCCRVDVHFFERIEEGARQAFADGKVVGMEQMQQDLLKKILHPETNTKH
jgi:hypothetical protein